MIAHSQTSLDQDLRSALDDVLAALNAAEIQECHVNGDRADVITSPPGSNWLNEHRVIARCATGDLWVKQAVAIAKSINFIRSLAAPPRTGHAGGVRPQRERIAAIVRAAMFADRDIQWMPFSERVRAMEKASHEAADDILTPAHAPDKAAEREGVEQGTIVDEPYDPLVCAVWATLLPFRDELLRTGGVTFMGLRKAIVETVRSFAIKSQQVALSQTSADERECWLTEPDSTGASRAYWPGISIPVDDAQPMSDPLLRIYRKIATGTKGAFMAPGDVAQLIAEIDRLRAALAPKPTGTEAGRGVIPVGWKLVPEEPTEEMLDAYWHQAGESRQMRARCHDTAFGHYRAMLAATPTPPTPDSTAQGDGTSQEGTR